MICLHLERYLSDSSWWDESPPRHIMYVFANVGPWFWCSSPGLGLNPHSHCVVVGCSTCHTCSPVQDNQSITYQRNELIQYHSPIGRHSKFQCHVPLALCRLTTWLDHMTMWSPYSLFLIRQRSDPTERCGPGNSVHVTARSLIVLNIILYQIYLIWHRI